MFLRVLLFLSLVCVANLGVTSPLLAKEDEAQNKPKPKMLSPHISPNGTHIIFGHYFEDELVLVSWDLVNNKQVIMKQPDKLFFDWVAWANNDRVLIGFKLTNSEAHLALQNSTKGDSERAEHTTATRLFSVDKSFDLSSVVNLFKLKMAVIPIGMTASTYANTIAFQDQIVDILPNDPDHILLNIDDDNNDASEVRRVNVYDASSELERRELEGVDFWFTDTNHQVRYGSRESNFGNVNYVAIYAGAIAHQPKTNNVFLNPETNRWENITTQKWSQDKGRFISFSPDNSMAYILTGKKLDLQDLAHNRLVKTLSDDLDFLLYEPDGVDLSRKVIGFKDETGPHYFDANYQALQKMIEGVFPNNKNYIVSAALAVGRFIIYSESTDDNGAYYLLDMQKGSLNKLSDRY